MRSLWLSLILVAAAVAVGCKSRQGVAPDTNQNRSLPSDVTSAANAPAPSAIPTPSAIPARSAIPAIDDKRPVLVCFGDSLTAGHGADAGQSYPDFLQKDLDNSGYGLRVVNEGISGNTTKDGLDRVDGILSLHPVLVVVEFGGNDGLRGLRIADSRNNLDAILAKLRAANIRFALAGISLPPDYGPDYIHQFQQTYTLLARKYNVPLLPFLLEGVYGVDGMMQEDRTHATAKGNEVVARNVLRLITPLLRKSAK